MAIAHPVSFSPSPRDAQGVLHRTRAPVAALHREVCPLPFDLSLWVQPERPPLQGSLHGHVRYYNLATNHTMGLVAILQCSSIEKMF